MAIVDRALRSRTLRNSFYRASRVPVISVLQRFLARRVVPAGQMRWIVVPTGLNAGLTMQVDPRAEVGYLRGDHEPWIQDLLSEWLAPGASFVDVGSHIGFFTMAASRLVGATGTVIAVEPDRATYRRLKMHIERNGLENVRAIAAAASASAGTVPFASSQGSDSGVRGSVVAEGSDSSYSVEATTLDDVAAEQTPTLIKIDVEGGEVAALSGAPRLLRSRLSKWIVEVHSDPLRQEVQQIFQAAGYVVDHTSPRQGDYGQDYIVAVPDSS
jgi:FkbM family methyltransferase